MTITESYGTLGEHVEMPERQRDRSTLLEELDARAWYYLRLEQGEVGGGPTMDWWDWILGGVPWAVK